MIREATFQDIDRCVDLAIESLNQKNWNVKIDRNKIKAIGNVAAMQKTLWVSETNGQISGVVGGILHDAAWFVGKQFEVVIFYCKDGNGLALLRVMRDWIKKNKIDFATVSLEDFMDDRYAKLFNRLGFTKPLRSFLYLRENDE